MSLNPLSEPSTSLGLVNGRLPAVGWRRSARSFGFMSMGSLLAGLPGGNAKTYAPSPVWRDSTTKTVQFQPLPKRQAVKIWHDARRFERQTRKPGKQDGALGRNGLAVLHALLFDFLNYARGTLEPGRPAIAVKACISERSVDRGLVKLKAAGVLNWLRRCVEEIVDGRFSLRQLTNAYAVLPPSQWRGYMALPPAPPPMPGTWGAGGDRSRRVVPGRAFFAARIEATRRSLSPRDVAAAIKALLDAQSAAMKAVADRRHSAAATGRQRRDAVRRGYREVLRHGGGPPVPKTS